jgi:hypothetical protein
MNGVLGRFPPLEKQDLQIVPVPITADFGLFEAGRTVYGVIDAGYSCPRCNKRVKGGTGTVPFVHRFDYCQCLMALRHPESEWNEILTEDGI